MLDRTFLMTCLKGVLLSAVYTNGALGDVIEFCGRPEASGYHFYCEAEIPNAPQESEQTQKQAPLSETQSQPLSQARPPADQPMEYTQKMEAFRALEAEAKYKAVLDPSPENIRAYMHISQFMGQQATLFAEVWQRVLMQEPTLDFNATWPITGTGNYIHKLERKAELEAAFVKAASTNGILFGFDGQGCSMCAEQGKILANMQAEYGVEVLPISLDGHGLETFEEFVTDTGQLAALGLEDLSAPFVAVVELGTERVTRIGAGLVTADQILERVYLVTALAQGEMLQ